GFHPAGRHTRRRGVLPCARRRAARRAQRLGARRAGGAQPGAAALPESIVGSAVRRRAPADARPGCRRDALAEERQSVSGARSVAHTAQPKIVISAITVTQMNSVRKTRRSALRAAALEFAGCSRKPVIAALPTSADRRSVCAWNG